MTTSLGGRPSQKDTQGREKGKGGKGGTKQFANRRGKFTLVGATPDNREICYAYNDPSKKGRCPGNCNRLHVCRILGCYAKHPMYEHKGWKKAEEEKGDSEA